MATAYSFASECHATWSNWNWNLRYFSKQKKEIRRQKLMSFRYGFFFAHATKYDKVRPFKTIPIIVVFFFFLCRWNCRVRRSSDFGNWVHNLKDISFSLFFVFTFDMFLVLADGVQEKYNGMMIRNNGVPSVGVFEDTRDVTICCGWKRVAVRRSLEKNCKRNITCWKHSAHVDFSFSFPLDRDGCQVPKKNNKNHQGETELMSGA